MSNKISAWQDTYPVLFLMLRVLLGMTLVIRGIYFLISIEPLYFLIKESSLSGLNMSMALALFVCWVHTLGGTFIILGLLTRISVWAQIPIILGAIFFINVNSGYPDFILAVVVLILLIVFAFAGAGKFSMDHYAKEHML